MTQPRTYNFPPDLFKRVKEFKPELRIQELERMVEHQKHVIAGLRAFNTKVVRQKHKNN